MLNLYDRGHARFIESELIGEIFPEVVGKVSKKKKNRY